MVVQFAGPLSTTDRDRLQSEGLVLLNYLGDHAWFVNAAKGNLDESVAKIEFIDDLLPIQTSWKLHPDFIEGRISRWTVTDRDFLRKMELATDQVERDQITHAADPLVAVYVLFHPDVPLVPMGPIRAALHGGNVISIMHSINGLVVELPYSRIFELAADSDVQYVEPALPKMTGLNDSSRSLTMVDVVQDSPYSLDGSGVNVLVYDSGTALASHQDFGGRLTVRDDSGLRDHSTHVAGILGGDGFVSGGQYKGMAPGVTIQSYGFEQSGGGSPGFLFFDPGDLEADYTEAVNTFGAVIANNSIGSNVAVSGFPCDWTGNYGTTSSLIDAIVRGSLGAPMRIIWSNGNERQVSTCGDSYKTTAPPAGAKNHITVGAVNSNDDSMTSFSSWGPTDDGRIKPDLVGPGCQSDDDFTVTSTSDMGGYSGRCGTSMSAPVVTGIGALMLQDFRIQYPALPDFRNSTLKALLTQTAVDLGNPGPDYQYGFGSVRAQPAIDQLRSGSWYEDQIDQDLVRPAFIEVLPGTSEIKVTLAWDDPAATPNVSTALINDLDLVVIDPNGIEHFPWTLNPSLPASPAIQTQPDRVNNIEQVVIDTPIEGIYRIEVRGWSVSIGPQTYSLTASPTLLACTSLGNVTLNRDIYECEDVATVEVIDCDLNADDDVIDTILVTLASDSEPGGETLLLTETALDSAVFTGSITLSLTDSTGVLNVADGDIVTVTYVDADDGAGGTNVDATDSAQIDCIAPVTTQVTVLDVSANTATIQVDFNEPVSATINYGLTCGSFPDAVENAVRQSSHTFNLTNLADDTTYYFELTMLDEAGNLGVDDQGGLCYTFKTDIVVNNFTELFDLDAFDLDRTSMLFIPTASVDFYNACQVPVSGLPRSTENAFTMAMPDDASLEVFLIDGRTIPFYGVSYNSIHVGSNGYVTFGAGDSARHESFIQHFSLPRIAMLFDDLNPDARGRVSYEQLDDRFVVTFEDIPQFGSLNNNTFQFELFFTGELRLTWFGIDAMTGLAGLSDGNGVSFDFAESDLSSEETCTPRYPDAPGSVEQIMNVLELTFALNAVDDGQPSPPGGLSFFVASLPAGQLRDDSNGKLITAIDLPYELAQGNVLRYLPVAAYVGPDGFNYSASDTGSAPQAGPSNLGIVLLDIVDPIIADVNLDGVVDVFDLLVVLSDWGPCPSCPGDIDGDSVVDVDDLLLLLANWGQTLPPPPPLINTGSSLKRLAGDQRDVQELLIDAKDDQDAFINDDVLLPARSGGLFEIDRDYLQTRRGELVMKILGPRPLEHYDVLVVNGIAQLGGGLTVILDEEARPEPGDRYVLMVAEEVWGEFEWYELPSFESHNRFIVEYGPRTVQIRIESDDVLGQGESSRVVPNLRLRGTRSLDVNRDGHLTVSDVIRLLQKWGTTNRRADVNRDGLVDGDDLLRLLEALADH
ncbi:MAG: S8 family serine peptidase [Planctomycetota bacterium]|nr:S8 family serine peptidase [Planctomycetota bacterium]